jgi:uncharacterized repeat protein (TIGR01451 family)
VLTKRLCPNASFIRSLYKVMAFALSFWMLLASQQAAAVYLNRYTTTTNGSITFVGNTLGLDGSNTFNSPGTNGSIGAFITTNTALRATAVSPNTSFPFGTTTDWTLNGSAANFTLPPGSTILYAELIWGGSYSFGGQNVSASLGNSVTFTTPAGTYSVAPAAATSQTQGVPDGAGNCTTLYCRYVRSANVTGLVQIGQSGSYVVGGVPATANSSEANNHAAGWTLAIVYSNPALPPRNLTVFVGAEFGGASPTGVTGFCTNLVGPVKGRLLVSALEGDTRIIGDQMLFGPNTGAMTPLSGPNNPVGNFFGGQINGDLGSLDLTGTFGTLNHNLPGSTSISGSRQGYDITNVDASGSLVNSQTSAFAQGTTSGDQYTINALGIQIDVGAPKFPLTVKSADRTVTYVGDTVTYTISLDNTTGTANATNVMFFDTPPPGMSFVPGSVTLNGTPLPGANPVTGAAVGTINAGTVSTVTFKVLVNAIPAAPAAAQYINRARWTYDFISCAGFPSEAGVVETNPNTILAIRLAPTKTVLPTGAVGVGQVLTYTINVPNTGAANSVGTTFTDLIPVGTTYVAGSTTMNGVVVPDVGANMPFTVGAPINSPSLASGVVGAGASAVIRFQVQVNPSPPAIITNTAAIDLDGTGPASPINVSAVNTPLSPPVATKSFAPSTIAADTPSVLTIQISNTNAQAFTLLALSDTLPAGVVIASPANATTTCGGGTPVAIPGGITLGLSGASVGASVSCTVSANVTSAAPGVYTNIIPAGGVTTTNAGNNIAPATAQLVVLRGPTINKSFSPSSIVPGGIATLTISVVNPTSVAINNANITDNLPPGVVVAAVPSATSTCAGTFAPVAGSNSVSLINGTVANANVCTMTVNVTSGAIGNYNNIIPAGALTSSGGTNAAAATADLVVTSPAISKSFTPTVVGSNVNSVLTIIMNNPTNVAATGVAFTDIFPTSPGALTLTDTTVVNTCAGVVSNQLGGALAVGSTGVRLTGGVIPAGSSCSITFNVRASVGGTYLNTIPAGGLTTTNIGNSVVATSATLSVGLPGVEKVFGTLATPFPTVALGANMRVSIRLTNPNTTALAITSLTDNLPSGMLIANTTTTSDCGGTFTDAAGGALGAGDTGIRLNGGSIPASSTCTFTFNVTSSIAATYVNTIPAGGLITPSGNNAFPASATIKVLARPILTKAFSPVTISPTGVSVLTITLTNPNGETLTTAAFSDTFPTTPGAMTLANSAVTNTCGGTITQSNNNALAVGSGSIKLASGSIPGNGSCQVVANVTASVAGSYANTIPIGGLTTNNGGASTVAANASLTVAVLAPTISKAFAASPVGRNIPTRLTFSVNNPNAALAITGVAFTDVLPTIPGAMVVAPVPNVLISGCGASPVFSPTAGAASISFSGGSVAVGSTCQVSVDVVAPVAGTYNNTSGAVTSTNAGTGGVATASLRVLSPPFVAKSFLPTPISVGGTSTLSLTISNPNATDILTGVAVSDVYPAGLLNSAAPNPQISCGAGSSVAFTGGVANNNSVGLTSGSLAPGSFCTVTVSVVASVAGNIDNTTLAATSTNAGTGNTAFARLVVGVDVTGFVYADANTNNAKDGAEAGTGLTLFAKLISAGVVQQVVTVNSTTGSYVFSAVPAGAYNVIVDTNNNPADITPTVTPGWAGTEAPTQNRAISVGSTSVMNVNFGLNSGTRISGRVFQDNGIASGTANDGILNGGEVGIAASAVRLTNCSGTTYFTTTTDGAGNYSFNVPSALVASGATLCVTQTLPSGFIETGASLGTTSAAAGSYNRTASTVTFTYIASTPQTGINFGNVPVNTLTTDGLQTALPGTAVNYTHAFVAGSGGLVSFSTAAVASPAVVGWSEIIYRDINCNGQIDTGEPTVSAAIAVNAGDQICLVVRQFVPGGAAIGAQNLVTLSANFSYTNASPVLSASLSRTDTTIVGTPSSSGLRLIKSVNLATALPGSILTYTITYRNDSTGPLSTLSINDTTPAFTNFVIATCGPIPSNLTSCTVSTAPTAGGVGAIVWTFVGTLAPAAQGTVTFAVQVNN